MKRTDIILQERHRDELRKLIVDENGAEGAAYVLLGRSVIGRDPLNCEPRSRYTSFEVIPIPDEDRVSASDRHVTWRTKSFVNLCRRAKEEQLIPGIVHSHPGGFDGFSKQDDKNELELFTLLRNRNGEGVELVSMVEVGGTLYRGRVWVEGAKPPNCERVSVVGQNGISIQGGSLPPGDPAFNRQALAFGDEVNGLLRQLTIGVVGCGGTGSAVVQLLNRLGVGRMVVIDDDVVEVSNLNRLHGATMQDALKKVAKVRVVADEVLRSGLDVGIHPIEGWVDLKDARDALRSCDVIFGCTDDHSGRIFLNRLSHFYLIPVIDVGLALIPRSDGKPGLQEMAARATVLFPGAPCMICRGIADPVRARDEDLKRRNPEEFERQKAEAYVVGAGNPAPAVVTFTTEAATMAVNELLQGLVDYRGEGKWAYNRYRRLSTAEERRQGVKRREDCSICGDLDNWGRGDVVPFLDRVG
ncbi:ThiF family adenylyltransferase [Shimia sp. R9_2]|uniref:ThiF family adenylyltransferase n=1 Tax=Shimia sp. R9_2 TaxID=2821112 RepID=UPI001ADB9C90|nr:ThiF family adenylyltransferase [Shimia sp. R9_2]MBO9395088.1 ThiF family adenylyltransferase [Shimia sp. R9_2]